MLSQAMERRRLGAAGALSVVCAAIFVGGDNFAKAVVIGAVAAVVLIVAVSGAIVFLISGWRANLAPERSQREDSFRVLDAMLKVRSERVPGAALLQNRQADELVALNSEGVDGVVDDQ